MPDRGASLLPMPPQEHTKPLRALLRAAGYRPAPRSGTAMAAYGVPAIYSGTLAAPSYGGYGKYGGYGGGYGGYGASSNLIGVENFEHSESGRKAQIIQCREPQVSAADLGDGSCSWLNKGQRVRGVKRLRAAASCCVCMKAACMGHSAGSEAQAA